MAEPHPDMSNYEAQAWQQLITRVARREDRRTTGLTQKGQQLASAAIARVEDVLDDHEGLRAISQGLGKPLAALQDLVTRGAAASVSTERLLKRAARRDPAVTSLGALRQADLRVADRLLHHHTLAYGVGLGVEGAATSLLITGFVVSSTVSGGTTLAAAAGALSTDVAANLAASSRVVAKIAATYGYDPRLPEEQVFALGVLNYGSTLTAGGKAASLGQLSRLVQTMMRQPTHLQLDKYVLVKATKEFLKLLGFRATHQRIAALIPVVGVVVNAGTNAGAIVRLSERAQEAYRLRFLTEKYGLDPAAWLAEVENSQLDEPSESIDLELLIEEADRERADSRTPDEVARR